MGCRSVGSTNTDTAGLGIILSFTIQAGLSFILSLWSISIELRHRELSRKLKGNGSDDTHSQGVDSTPDHRERCALGFKGKAVSRVLMEISDIQTFNGIALLIGAYARRRTLDLYHYHIVYDTISFTGISTAPALVLTFERSNVILLRAVSVFILLCLYIGFVIIFGIKLQSWNDDITGHCYISDNISNREAVHPYVDNVYLALTALYFCTALILCLGVAVYNMLRRLGLNRFLGVIKAYFLMDRRLWWSLPFPPLQVLKWELRIFKRILDQVSGWALDRQPGWAPVGQFLRWISRWIDKIILIPDLSLLTPSITISCIALVQYPLHTYMLFTLRASNEPYLSGESENEWGFGQVVALVIIGLVISECIHATVEYKAQMLGKDESKSNSIWLRFLSLHREQSADHQECLRPRVSPDPGHIRGLDMRATI